MSLPGSLGLASTVDSRKATRPDGGWPRTAARLGPKVPRRSSEARLDHVLGLVRLLDQDDGSAIELE